MLWLGKVYENSSKTGRGSCCHGMAPGSLHRACWGARGRGTVPLVKQRNAFHAVSILCFTSCCITGQIPVGPWLCTTQMISLGRGDFFCLPFFFFPFLLDFFFLKPPSLDTWGGNWCLEVTCSTPGLGASWGGGEPRPSAGMLLAGWLQLWAGTMPLVSSWRCCYQNSSTLSIKCCKHLLC